MKRFYVLCLCFFCSLASMAQKNVESLDLYKDYSLVAPAIIDSTDVNGKQFELSSALKVPAFDGNYINRLTAETDGITEVIGREAGPMPVTLQVLPSGSASSKNAISFAVASMPPQCPITNWKCRGSAR